VANVFNGPPGSPAREALAHFVGAAQVVGAVYTVAVPLQPQNLVVVAVAGEGSNVTLGVTLRALKAAADSVGEAAGIVFGAGDELRKVYRAVSSRGGGLEETPL